MEDQRLSSIEKKLDAHGSTLCEIKETINMMAVQNERIASIQKQLSSLWEKYDELANPNDGLLTGIKTFQASCPRKSITTQVRWLQGTFVPLIITQIAIAIRLLK